MAIQKAGDSRGTLLIKKLSLEPFYCTCIEFWWCLCKVVKGVRREEIFC